MQALKEYAVLNDERACILEQCGWRKGEDGSFGYTGEPDAKRQL